MQTAQYQKTLLSFNGVTKKRLVRLNLTRFLLHDKPFAVFSFNENGREVLHLKLLKGKAKEYLARFKGKISLSSLYNSSNWLQLVLENADEKLVNELLITSYKALVGELAQLSQVVYTEKHPLKYDIDYKAALEGAKPFAELEYGKKVLDF